MHALDDAGVTSAKKSKNKKKKRAAEAAQAALADVLEAPVEDCDVERATNTSMASLGDAEFQEWCKAALERNASKEILNMSAEDLLKPPKPFWGYQYSGMLRT
eukprot:3868696-Amphidinium_carterae.1